nr:cytochrome p450 [Quercus suber]
MARAKNQKAANKFVFTSDSSALSSHQTQSSRKILGERNILELSGEDHKRVRGAIVSFLQPESLKQYVGKIDGVKKHLEMHWQGKPQVKVLPLTKILAFDIICSLLFRLEQGARKDRFVTCFQEMIEEVWSIPINLPFTRYNRSLKASAKVRNMVKELIREKRVELEQKVASPCQDLITRMLSSRNENNEEAVTEKEIVDNVILVMVAGHDTSSVLITFTMRLLANEPAVYAAVLQEQEEIAKSASPRESF